MKFTGVKKILVATVLVAALTTVGSAWAGGKKERAENRDNWNKGAWGRHHSARGEMGRWRHKSVWGGPRFMMGRMGWQAGKTGVKAFEVPQEIKEKWAEAKKTAIDLRTELSKTPISREKALELHAKHRSLVQEISDWYFLQRLDALEAKAEAK